MVVPPVVSESVWKVRREAVPLAEDWFCKINWSATPPAKMFESVVVPALKAPEMVEEAETTKPMEVVGLMYWFVATVVQMFSAVEAAESSAEHCTLPEESVVNAPPPAKPLQMRLLIWSPPPATSWP
jgi:hypothetical protein